MRKIINLTACLALLVMLAFSVFAADSFTLGVKPAKNTVYAGDSVEIIVSVSEFNACTGGSVKITYDAAIFERSNNSWTFSTTPIMSVPDGDASFAYGSSAATKVSGNIYKFTMKVKKDVPLGSYNITVRMDLKNASGTSTVNKTISITVGCKHVYDNNCDTACNSCGETRKITHSWDKGKVTKAAGCTTTGEKLYTCKVCSKTKTETIKKTGHKYDNDCDTTCNSCGQTREISHAYESKWSVDANSHWYACKVCGTKKDEAVHTYTTVLTETTGGHGYACTGCGYFAQVVEHVFENECDADCGDCGYQRETEHNYGDRWAYDENGHWHACTVCGDELEMVPHTPSGEVTETIDQLCLDCGYIIQTAINHQHILVGDWCIDENSHWFLCYCGVYTDPAEHTWNAGIIDLDQCIVSYHCTLCGFSRTEEYVQPTEPPTTAPPETTLPTEPTDPTEPTEKPQDPVEEEAFPLWIVLAVLLGVSVLGNIILIFSLAASKRRGRFSD